MNPLFKYLLSFAVTAVSRQISGRSAREEIEKAKALMKVADSHLSRFNKAREVEWFGNISFWALIIIIGGFLIEKVPVESLPVFSHREFYYVFGGILAFGHFLWLSWMQEAQHADKVAYFKCRDKALEHIQSLEAIGATSAKTLRQSGWLGVMAGSLVTLMLAWSATYLVLAKAPTVAVPQAETEPIIILEDIDSSYQFSPNLYLSDISPLRLTDAESILGSSVSLE